MTELITEHWDGEIMRRVVAEKIAQRHGDKANNYEFDLPTICKAMDTVLAQSESEAFAWVEDDQIFFSTTAAAAASFDQQEIANKIAEKTV
jgi:hypothetical protein